MEENNSMTVTQLLWFLYSALIRARDNNDTETLDRLLRNDFEEAFGEYDEIGPRRITISICESARDALAGEAWKSERWTREEIEAVGYSPNAMKHLVQGLRLTLVKALEQKDAHDLDYINNTCLLITEAARSHGTSGDAVCNAVKTINECAVSAIKTKCQIYNVPGATEIDEILT